jgi:hypothetical protein
MKRFAPLALLLLSGCATLTAEPTQTITVKTEPSGAACTLSNRAGSWNIETTPGTAPVTRSFSPLVIECESKKSGHATRTVAPSTSDRAYGNIALGGVPALVDAATEKGYKYDPEHVTLKLEK